MDDTIRERVVNSLQRQLGKRLGSDEVEDAYGHMLEKLSKLPVGEIDSIENPGTWLYVGMRNRLIDQLRLHRSRNVHIEDLGRPDGASFDDSFSDGDDSVAGAVIGRESASERLAEVAELVWLKFSGDDGQIAARILLENAKPQAVAAELGLDPAYVSTVAHKAHQEHRLLERKLKEDPEFRCWRLRKHTNTYYATGQVSLALRAHWVTCSKCRAAQHVVRERTAAALNPLLPGAATLAAAGGIAHRILHHHANPVRALRRLLRPAGHAGAQATASSSQAATVGATVATKAAVIATVAVVSTTAAGATTLAVVHHHPHHSHHHVAYTPPAPATTTPQPPSAPTAVHPTAIAQVAAPVVHGASHTQKHRARPARSTHHAHHHRPAPVFHSDVVQTPTTPTQTQSAPTAPTPTPAATPEPVQHSPAPPSSTPASSSSGGSVTNPSYSTPTAP